MKLRSSHLLLTAAMTLLAVPLLLGTPPASARGAKVDVCHIPPDDPGNFHTITVSEKALDAHLAHGDFAGACEDCPCAAGVASFDWLPLDSEACFSNGILSQFQQRIFDGSGRHIVFFVQESLFPIAGPDAQDFCTVLIDNVPHPGANHGEISAAQIRSCLALAVGDTSCFP